MSASPETFTPPPAQEDQSDVLDREAASGAAPDQAQPDFDWFSRGPAEGDNTAPPVRRHSAEAPAAQTQQETTAEQHDAQVQYSDAELLGRSFRVRRVIQEAGTQRIKAWQGMKAKVRNAFDTPGKAIRKFALNRAKNGLKNKEERLEFATSERAKKYHQNKVDRAADKLMKREVSHDTRVKRMEERTQAVHDNAERRRRIYIKELKTKKGDKLTKKALKRQLREEGEGWYARKKIAAETAAELKQRPEQRKQLGDVVMNYAVSHRYEGKARRGYNRADRSRQRTDRSMTRTSERMENAGRDRQEASEAYMATQELLVQARAHTAELQAKLDAEVPDTARYNVMAAALRESEELAASHEASMAEYMQRAQEGLQDEVDSRARSFDLNTQYAERDARATEAHKDVVRTRRTSRQHKAALDEGVRVALNPNKH